MEERFSSLTQKFHNVRWVDVRGHVSQSRLTLETPLCVGQANMVFARGLSLLCAAEESSSVEVLTESGRKRVLRIPQCFAVEREGHAVY